MEEDQISLEQSPSGIYELWVIATHAIGTYVETLDVLQGDAVEKPEESCRAWSWEDMADCARNWCIMVIYQQWSRKARKSDSRLTDKEEAEAQRKHDQETLWNSFKIEFRLLACTKDKKYEDLRAQIAKMTGQKGQLAITSAIASGLAVNMGVTLSTILTPLCAICLLAGANIGRELLCKCLAQRGFQKFGVTLGTFGPKE
jgi:hypothetical protein